MPEYCPDIARIIKVDCTPFAESCEVSDGKATVSGKAVYDVLYETDYKNRLRCVSFTQDFSQSLTLPRTDLSNVSAFCNVFCEKISCKLVSPRRLVIKSTLATCFDAEGELAVKAIAVNEDSKTFFRKKTIGFDGRTRICECESKFNDLLSLAQSEKSYGEIICGNISLQTPIVALSPGNAEIKTTASIHILCEEESNEGNYYVTEKTMPISLLHSDEAIQDFKHITVELEVLDPEFSPELDQYGESRVVKTAFSVKARLKINEPKAYTVADDMFEKDFEGICTLKTVSLPQILSQSETGFSVESKLRATVPNAESILDSTVRNLGTSAVKTESGVEINGDFVVTLLAKTSEGIQSFDYTLPYTQLIRAELPEGESELLISVTPVEALTTLHSDGSVTVRIISSARLTVCTSINESFIADVSKRVPIPEAESENALVYCFPQHGEDLWSIAKLYRINPANIREANPELFDEQGKLTDVGKPILVKA